MTPSEPSKWIAAIQAAAVYALTALALFWGVSFSFSAASVSPILQQVSLLPVQVAPPPKVAAKPKPAPAPPKISPETKNPPDADIALKKRQEEEQKRRKEIEREKHEVEEQKRKEEEAQKEHEKEKKWREEEEQKQLEQKRDKERRNREQRAKDIERQNELGKQKGKIKWQIQRRIEDKHRHPTSVPEDAEIEVEVSFGLVPIGEGRARLQGEPEIISSSGDLEYDRSVIRAIIQVGIFPFPDAPELLEDFSVINLRMSPQE